MALKIADLFAKLGIRFDQKSFSTADRLLGGIKKAVVGIAAFQGVKWFGGLIADTQRAALEFERIEQRVGIASETMQGFAFAAEASGVEVDNFTEFVQDLSEKTVEAAEGNKDLKKAFKSLGLEIPRSVKDLPSAEEMVLRVADAYAGMEDGAKKTQLTMQLFSDEGTKMIPVLNKGRAGIDDLRNEFVDLGGVIDEESSERMKALDKDSIRLRASLRGLRNQAVAAIVPTLQKMAKGMLVWIKANRALLKQRLAAVFKGLVFVLGTLGKAIGFIIDHWRELGIAFASIQITKYIYAFVAAMNAAKIASVRAALASMAAWAAALAPFILLAAGVAAVILIVQDLYSWFTGGESVFEDFYEAAKKWIVDKFKGLVNDAKMLWGDLKRVFGLTDEERKDFHQNVTEAWAAPNVAELAMRGGTDVTRKRKSLFDTASEQQRRLTRAERRRQMLTYGRDPGSTNTRTETTNINVNVANPAASAFEIASEIQKAKERSNRATAGAFPEPAPAVGVD